MLVFDAPTSEAIIRVLADRLVRVSLFKRKSSKCPSVVRKKGTCQDRVVPHDGSPQINLSQDS